MRALAFCLALALPATASAETFTLSLGGGSIGTLDFTGADLRANVTDSPMGLANGTFSASSRAVQMADGRQVTQFLSDAPRKGRRISVLHDGGRAIETTVSPASDATDLSDAAAVPAGVIDPVQAFGRMTSGGDCPGAFSFYDGRRVVTLSPTGRDGAGDTLVCRMSYRVTAGKGHLSPLNIKSADVALHYAGGRMARLEIGSGPFTLYMSR